MRAIPVRGLSRTGGAALVCGLLLAAGVLATPVAASRVSYAIVDLGVLPGATDARGTAVSDAGHVVGVSGGLPFVASTAPGSLRPLPMLDGWTQATPEAVNDAGLVVGAAFAPETGFVAALWTPVGTEHTVTVLPLPDGANEGYPFDVDSGGTVVGCARGPGFVQAAVVWRSAAGAYGVPESLPGVPGSETGCATSANGLGWIAGWSGPVLPAVYRAVVWIPSAGGYEVRDLGILRGGIEFSQAWDLNDAGVVVGDSHAAHDHIEGFVWFHRLRSLGTLGGDTSSARAINDAGTIAGWSATSSGAVHAVLWRHGSRLDLGTLPAGDRSAANDVNDFGVVVGLSNAESFGPAHAVAWLPVAGRP